jgi:hypothetical protein
MLLKRNKVRSWAIFFTPLLLAAIFWVVHDREQKLPTTFVATRGHPTPSADSPSRTVNAMPKSNEAQLSNAPPVSEKSFSTVPATKSLAWMQNMMELLQQAPRAENVATRSFAVYMPSVLCMSVSTARSLGPSTLKEDIPFKRIPHNERGLERIAQRCSEYSDRGALRSTVLAGLKAENAPLTAFFSAMDTSPESARSHLSKALAEYDATSLQPLAIGWPLRNTERIEATLPDEFKPYAQGIVTAAFDIALCRAGAYCATDSIALDMVCAKFAERNATDVESAYRQLHSAAGISFAETSRMADWTRDAIQRRDTNALWPNTAGFPSTRK